MQDLLTFTAEQANKKRNSYIVYPRSRNSLINMKSNGQYNKEQLGIISKRNQKWQPRNEFTYPVLAAIIKLVLLIPSMSDDREERTNHTAEGIVFLSGNVTKNNRIRLSLYSKM